MSAVEHRKRAEPANRSVPAPPTLAALAAGHWISRAIHVAAKLRVADLLADGPLDASILAQRTGAHPDALFRLLRALAAVGVFSRRDGGRFGLTSLGETLRSDAPGSLYDYVMMLGSAESWQAWQHMEDAVATGTPAFDHAFGMPIFEYFAKNPALGRIFDKAMRSRSAADHDAVVAAYDFSQAAHIVDVGGGEGTFLAAVLQSAPRAKGTLFERPQAAAAAQAAVAVSEAGGRIEVLAGDFFVAVPNGADLYLIKQVVHDWNDEQAVSILANCRRAMSATSRLLILEMLIGAENTPVFANMLDLMMLVSTGGRERTLTEYRQLASKAGLDVTRVVPTSVPLTILEAVPIRRDVGNYGGSEAR
jgi:O-methyltransferase/methyltransferase family protein